MYTYACTYIGRLAVYRFGISRSNCSIRSIYSSSPALSNYIPTSASKNRENEDDLRSRIIGLIFPRRSATMVLQNWVEEGHNVSGSELRRITKQLMKYRRHKHALEILTWMETRDKFKITAADRAIRLDLIIKEHNVAEAEMYFANIPDPTSKKAAFLPLLHSYVKERATEKAEALMLKMNEVGPIVSPHPLNEMMKLYAATSQFKKVLSVIRHMKRNKIPRNVLSYNLWMTACGEVSGFSSAEMVYKEMANDKLVEVGWSSLATLANIYSKAGLIENTNLALKNAETKLSACNRLGYFFLITLYTSINNKDGVLRLWEASKEVQGKLTCANYISILSSLVKLGDIQEAEKIFMEWESQCRKYDIRVSNVLLGAYMRSGLTEKAESLHLRTLERSGSPNYKTWEILMEGWMKKGDMDKAINAMKKGFAMLKHCDWRPSPNIVIAIAEYLEEGGELEDAKRYLEVIRRFGLANLAVYKSIIRMHASNQRPIHDILVMMEKDKIDNDDEASTLIHSFEVEDR